MRREFYKVHDRVVLVCPSTGLNGGIERYADTLRQAIAANDVLVERFNLRSGTYRAGPLAHGRLFRQLLRHLRRDDRRIVVLHLNLLPVTLLAASLRRCARVSVVCHGQEVWDPKRAFLLYLAKLRSVDLIAVSNFTAGHIFRYAPAAVLKPNLDSEWIRKLEAARTAGQSAAGRCSEHAKVRVITVFRLLDADAKGLPQIVDAIRQVGESDFELTICGASPVPDSLKELAEGREWVQLRVDVSDDQLAREYAAADLMVLATQTSVGGTGEGFGMVLTEAQLAGTGVISPAYGGSGDAFQEGVTGFRPASEDSASIASLLRSVRRGHIDSQELGLRAAKWARAEVDSSTYASLVQRVILS